MHSIQRRLARDCYIPSLQKLVDFGEPVDVRGRKTIEFINYITEIDEPWHHCIYIPSRRWNPWIAMSEALWILAGRNDIASLKPYNSRISDFSDDGVLLYGAYGARLYEQIDPLIERLQRDTSDRRAVLSIWRSEDSGFARVNDLIVESKDPPCNNMVYFKLRQNKLHMTVINRSNDIHWGLYAVNIPTFGILQVYLAARLGVEVGTQTHLSNSFHVYTDDHNANDITDRMLYQGKEDLPMYPSHQMVFYPGEKFGDHKRMAEMCGMVLDGRKLPPHAPIFLKFANKFLSCYKERDSLALPTEWHEFQDWNASASMFARNVWSKNAVSS